MTTVLNTLLTQHDVGAGADPNDIQFTHTGAVDASSGHSSTTFATITIPAGAEATLHCFVPIGCQQDHAHGPNEYPNMIDPQGGWTESSETYLENNGIERKRFFKKVVATSGPIQCECTMVRCWSLAAADSCCGCGQTLSTTPFISAGAMSTWWSCSRQATALYTHRPSTKCWSPT